MDVVVPNFLQWNLFSLEYEYNENSFKDDKK